jgi:DNA-binding response OmpR family regulator
MRGGEAPTILVIEDDDAIRELLLDGLRFEGYRSVGAATAESGIELCTTARPRGVILDIMLPGTDGLSALPELRRRAPEAAILMLTAKDAVSDRVAGLDRGADDYVVKPFAFPELLARLRAQLRVRTPAEADQLEFEDVVLDRRAHRVTRGGEPVTLSRTEFELLAFLMAHPGRAFSKDAILNGVWGYEYVGDPNVVEVYVSYLRDKLGDRNRTLIQTVRGLGYRLGDG